MNVNWLYAVPIAFAIGGLVGIKVEDHKIAYASNYEKSVLKSQVRTCEKVNNTPCHFVSRYDNVAETLVWQVIPKP